MARRTVQRPLISLLISQNVTNVWRLSFKARLDVSARDFFFFTAGLYTYYVSVRNVGLPRYICSV